MINKILIYIFIGAGFSACSSVNSIKVTNEQISVTNKFDKANSADSMITPYRTDLNKEMLDIIGYAPDNFERGKPNGALNNWSTDAILNSQLSKLDKSKPAMCLLNWGGLRNPISKGDVTLADVYKLMPFDNEIVIVEMPISTIEQIEEYQKARGGEPIAGATIDNGKLKFNSVVDAESFYIVTSDYLMNGGDNMVFFQERLNVIYAGDLMRDVMIETVKNQKTLVWSDEQRINF